MITFKDLVRTSRPLFWLNTSVLWVLGLLVLQESPTWVDLMMIAYFTLPFNLWLHGINDVYDFESDSLNERKGSAEGALLSRALHQPMLYYTLLWNVPFWLLALWQGNLLAILLLSFFLFLGWAYSAPPIRGKSRPFLDSLINTAYILPYLIVLAWHDASLSVWQASWPAILAFAAWSMASHAFTSIQDIEADRAGGISTIATFLGATYTTWFSLIFYLVATGITLYYGLQWSAIIAIYVLLVIWYMVRPSRVRANQLYRGFILLNSTIGFLITVTLALAYSAHTLWAATVVLSLVGVVVLSLNWAQHEKKEREHG